MEVGDTHLLWAEQVLEDGNVCSACLTDGSSSQIFEHDQERSLWLFRDMSILIWWWMRLACFLPYIRAKT